MAKILFVTLALLILTFVIIAMYSASGAACRSGDISQKNKSEQAQGALCEKQICPQCKVGKESYELDSSSDACPYIGSLQDGKCDYYIPLDKFSKKRYFWRSQK